MMMMMMVRLAPLLFLLMIREVVSDDDDCNLKVNYSPSHICALKDSSVIMSCTYTFSSKFRIGKVFWTTKKGKDLSKDPKYSQRLQYLGDKQQNCTVRLSHVTKKDEHQYYFRITEKDDDDKCIGRPGVSVSVTDLQVESPERVTEGDSVRLTCKSSCTLTDTPTFIWYRNSQPLTERRGRNNELLLQSVRREDAGRYRCAVHGHTLTSPDVNLNVMYPPKNVSVSISGSAVIVSGDSVTLSCSSDSNPPAEISWFKEETFVGSGGIFSISKISSDDSGEYKCRARNEHGEKDSDPVTLNVKYPPKSVSVSINGPAEIVSGDSVTLSCSSDSNPPPELNWFKGKTLVKSGRIFNISKISSGDSGEYKCKARNDHGEKYSDPVTLNVMYPPRNVSVSIIDSVSLSCISDSNPPALNFSWFKENQSSSVGSGQSFSAVQSGRFYCEAHNPHGSQRSDAVTVTVKEQDYTIQYIVCVIAAVCVLLFLICIFIFIRWRKNAVSQNQVHQATSSDRLVFENSLYQSILLKIFRTGQNDANVNTNNKTLYENLKTPLPGSAVRSNAMVNETGIYSLLTAPRQ